MMLPDEYRFVRISEERLADFAAVAKDAFGATLDLKATKSLFDTGYRGKGYIGFLAYSRANDEPAAFYGVFPYLIEYNGKQYLAAQSGSTMTHSKHRQKGLFYKLAQETYKLAKQEGICFVYGFPNANSYPGLIKLNWTHDGNMNSYHVFVPTLPFGYLAQKINFLQPLFDYWFRFVIGFWRTESRPFKNSADEPGIGTVCHDTAFFSYKKDTDHRFMIKTSGRLVWINQHQGILGIGDIELIDDGKDFKKILRMLKFICFLSGCVHLRTYLSPNCKIDRLFREKGYQPWTGLANCHINLDSDLPLENFKYVYADYDTF